MRYWPPASRIDRGACGAARTGKYSASETTCRRRPLAAGIEAVREDAMAIEIRPAQALKLLHDFSYALVTDRQPDLSPRQLTILLTIYLDPPPHNVRGLARKLKVTKPVITRALDTMGKLGLVARRRDDADRRNVVIQRTVKGALAVEQLGDLLTRTAKGLSR
jgi:DNA-binding MarR family transcriptional regulator